jgi:nucleoside-diphosphate-sugar epimerase
VRRRLLTGMGNHLLAVTEAITASGFGGSLAWFGSAMAYGPADAVARVDEAARPATFRGAVKAAESLLVARLAVDLGVALTELRVFSAYGPFQQRDRLVSRLLHAGLTGERVPLAATAYRRDWIHCDDIAAACVAAALAPSSTPRIVNVCTGRTHDTHQVAHALERIAGRPLVAEHRPEMTDHYGHARVGELPSAASGIEWTPRFDLEAGLAQCWDWARTAAGHDYLLQDATAGA